MDDLRPPLRCRDSSTYPSGVELKSLRIGRANYDASLASGGLSLHFTRDMLCSPASSGAITCLPAIQFQLQAVDETPSLSRVYGIDQTNLSLKGEVCGQVAFA